ncbi:MAG: NAD(P)-dependent dehydrogenase (short-subunit alcohol dehydrogenase family) [Halieaceae bacterium]|jgi:NAD(P)-dependent dehydrogenase (short-subunit alcohol dehydrogenase family)
MDLGLDGKVALIFGGSKGIGLATAVALAAEGANLALAARQLESFAELPPELAGPMVLRLAADLTMDAEVEQAVQDTLERFGRIDILVISAGAAQGGVFWELADDIWDAALGLKLMGTVRALRAVAPVMQAQGAGRIVVVVGNAGKQPNKRMLPGAAANAACLAVVRGLAEELAPAGVQVNAVNPGPTRTGRWTTQMEGLGAASGKSADAVEDEFRAAIPLGRLSEPAEIGRLIAVLASDVSGTTTGTSLTIDGGMTKALA